MWLARRCPQASPCSPAKGIPSATGSPGSQAGSALTGSEGADGAGDEGKALLFVPIQKSAAFELLFQWPSVPPSLCIQRGLGLIHSLLLFGILSREAAWLVPSSGSHGTKLMNLLLIQSQQSWARRTQNVLQEFPEPLHSFQVHRYLSCFHAAGEIYPTPPHQNSSTLSP